MTRLDFVWATLTIVGGAIAVLLFWAAPWAP